MARNQPNDGLAEVRGTQCRYFADGSRRPGIATGFCRTVRDADFILDAPDNGTVGIFLAFGLVILLQVVGVTFIDHASLFCV